MKVSRLYLILSTLVFNCAVAMEEGIRKPERYQPEMFIGGGKLGEKSTKSLPQNIWTRIAQLGIKPFGKTEEEIFRVTDLMMYPKKSKESGKEEVTVGSKIDLKKVSAQAGLRKALQALISEAGLKKGIQNYSYEQFKADIMNDILRKKLGDSGLLVDAAAQLKAYNWSKFYLDKEYLSEYLIKVMQINDELHVRWALELGADPNVLLPMRGWATTPFFKLLSHYYSKQYINDIDYKRLSQSYIKTIDLFLKYGGDPLLDTSEGLLIDGKIVKSPYEILNLKLKDSESGMGAMSYYTGYRVPQMVKDLREIKRLFDEAIEKQKIGKQKELVDKQGKEEQK